MDRRNIPWKAEWKAAGLDPGPLSPDEEALVPRLQEENRAFLERHPRVAKTAPVKNPLVRILWATPLVAAAALVLMIQTVPTATPDLERVKGDSTRVAVYRQGPGGAERLAPGALVQPGDVLQAAYQVTKAVQGALISVDGDGNVTVHLASGGRSVALVPGAEKPLEFSYELDRAPRYEVFFLVTSNKAFELEPIRQTLKKVPWNALKPGDLGAGIDFSVLALNKASPQ